MKNIFFALSCFLILQSCGTSGGNKVSDTKTPLSISETSIAMGETLLNKYPDLFSIENASRPKWGYTFGLVSLAMFDLYEETGEEKYLNYARAYVDSLVDEEGIIKTYKKSDYNIDKINSGKVLFRLYDITGEEKYKIAMDTLRVQLREHPRTKIGGFWHKKRYPHQMWLDGLYMGGPFYAQYAQQFGSPDSFDEVALWFMNMEKVARDPESGLLYHGWDESRQMDWADKETGLSECFWGRGMGWYAMALVDVLDYMPEGHFGYDSIVNISKRYAEAIVKVQDEKTGTWYQVLDQGEREGNYLEGSVSAMFSYFLLKAINKGYIDKDLYTDAAMKAYEGTLQNLVKVDQAGYLTITPVCAVAGLGGSNNRSGKYEYYISESMRDNDPKAVGPFIMAGIQYKHLTKE